MHSLNDEPLSEADMAAPDIFDRFRITFTAADVEKIDVISAESVTLYAVTMTDAYADSYDVSADGATYDCTRMVYNYYFDAKGNMTQVISEQKATLTDAAGTAQEVTKFSDASAR